MLSKIKIKSEGENIWLNGKLMEEQLRTEAVAAAASEIAQNEDVRNFLNKIQRSFCEPLGLVAEGRDMGTIVFPEAKLKVFLTADVETRAARRYKQLIEKGLDASLIDILEEIRQRDNRDESRLASPLVMSNEARYLDSTNKTPKFVIDQIVRWFEEG